MKLLTRKEIIEIWSKPPSLFLNSFCCPSCRDILDEDKNMYRCTNDKCLEDYFIKDGEGGVK